MKKHLLIFLVISVLINGVIPAQTDPKIASVIGKVNTDSLYENLQYLTGEKSVTISSGTYYITSRNYIHYGNLIAEEYLLNRLKSYLPATSSMQFFEGGGGNVIAVQRGSKYPDKYIIIGAHFDSKPDQGPAPGADDNGSGTSAVIEAARILHQETTDYSIVYALWDNEEIGLLGSKFYAQQAHSKNDDIVAVINLDMIAWDSNNDSFAEIHTRGVGQSNQIADNLIKISSDYGIGLEFAVINPGSTASDHSSFWTYNYSAVMLIEGYFSGDFNDNYHKISDNILNINRSYFHKCAKAAIGTLAYYAGISSSASAEPELPVSYSLSQNFPNPFNPSTKIKYSVGKESHVKLIIYDALGKEIVTLVNRMQQPDDYEVRFEAADLSSGVYFYVLYAGDQISMKKMVLIK